MAQGQGDGSVGRGLEFDPSVCKNQCPIGIPVVELQEMGTGAHWPGSRTKSRSFKLSGKPLCQKLRWRTIEKDMTLTCANAFIHVTHIHIHTNTCTHTYKYTHIFTHTHINTHTYI